MADNEYKVYNVRLYFDTYIESKSPEDVMEDIWDQLYSNDTIKYKDLEVEVLGELTPEETKEYYVQKTGEEEEDEE